MPNSSRPERRRRLKLLPLLILVLLGSPAARALPLPDRWPPPTARQGRPVTYPSASPFTPGDMGEGVERTDAKGTFFLPDGAGPRDRAPAVVLLHGSSGIAKAREITYARQLADNGVAALVVDTFGARKDKGTGYVERVLNITESMAIADAYAGLRWLKTQPGVDGERVALAGFSYGGMATLYAANAGVARLMAPDGIRFKAHVAYYAPCIVDFADPATTGAPVLMLMGDKDALIDPARCRATADALRAGGSPVAFDVLPGAYHQWDGDRSRHLGRGLAACRFRLGADGSVTDARTGAAAGGYTGRGLALWLCTDASGFEVRADPAIRARSNLLLARFLNDALALEPAG